MTVIAVTSSRTSPGATSLATGLALALSSEYDRSLLIEADPAGGVLSLRFDLEVTPSLTTFGSDIRNGYSHDTVWRNTQDLRGTRCIPAPVDPRLARSWVERVTPRLVQHLPSIGAPVVIDLGWVGEDGPSLGLAQAADVTLVVSRPEIAEVQALLFQVRQLQAGGATVGLVTIGTTPNDPQEVAAVAGIPLVAVLPDDPKVAAALRGAKFAPNKFRRSLLWRTISGIAATLVDPGLVLGRSESADGEVGVDGTGNPGVISDEAVAAASPAAYAELAPEMLDAELAPVTASLPAHIADAAPMPTPWVAPADSAPAASAPAFDPGPPPVYVPAPLEPVTAETPEVAPLEPVTAETPEVAAGDHSAAPSSDDEVDIDLTIDPDKYDVTTRIDALPDAEIVLSTGERRRLDPARPTLIGRNGECQIVIRDSQVSRRHGRLTRTLTGWHYADLGSRNGSVLNGHPCTDAFLSSGDELYIGHDRLTFELVPAAELVPSARTTAAAPHEPTIADLRETESA